MTDHGFDSKWKGITDPLEVQSSLTFLLYYIDLMAEQNFGKRIKIILYIISS